MCLLIAFPCVRKRLFSGRVVVAAENGRRSEWVGAVGMQVMGN